jgi:outer membrane murein-binding lipoprotein Lpp
LSQRPNRGIYYVHERENRMEGDDRGRYHMTREAEVTLGTLSGKLDTMSGTINTMATEVRKLAVAQAETSSSVKSSWHEVNALKKDVKRMPERMRALVGEHANNCIPRQKAINRALSNNSDTQILLPDDSKVIPLPAIPSAPSLNIPKGIIKWFVIGVIILGGLLVGGGIMIGATVTDAPKKASKVLNRDQ